MTKINTIEDFVRVMDDNPEWLEAVRARLLTREVLELPRRMEELTAVVHQMADTQRAQGRDIAEMKDTQREQGRDIAELKDTQRAQGRDIAELKDTQREQGRDIAELKDTTRQLAETQREQGRDIADLKDTTRRIEETQNLMTESQNLMAAALNRQGGEIASLKGLHTEYLLGKQIYGIISEEPLKLHRVRFVRGHGWSTAFDKFNMDVNQAFQDGRISRRQYDRVIDTDMILLALRLGSGREDCLAVEASSKVNRNDIDRVVQTREALETAFPEMVTHAAVYGYEISEQDALHAKSQSVFVFFVRSRD